MKLLQETLFERIRNRMAPANAVKVITALQRVSGGGVDYLAVKEASEMVERYKLEARIAIRQYRKWQLRGASHILTAPHHAQHGRILLQAARDSAALYLDAHRDYLDLVSLALMKIKTTRTPANDYRHFQD